MNKAVAQFTTNKSFDIPTSKVFICVGENEGPSMIPGIEKFKSSLKITDYEKVDLKWQIFEGESHMSVMPASISKTITTLYGKK